jgi:hypothetical protein
LKIFVAGVFVARDTDNGFGQVVGNNGLLEEMSAADEFYGFALAQFFDELRVAAVHGQAAKQRCWAVDMTRADDGPVHVAGVPVNECLFAKSFSIPVIFPAIGIFRLGEAAAGGIVNEIGGDENELFGPQMKQFYILLDVAGIETDAVYDQVPGYILPGYDVLHGLIVMAVGDEGLYAGDHGALAARYGPDLVVIRKRGSCYGSADMPTTADDKNLHVFLV